MLDIQLSKAALIRAIGFVEPLVNPKSAIVVERHVKFHRLKGRLFLYAKGSSYVNSQDLTIAYEFDNHDSNGGDGEVTIPFQRLKDIVNNNHVDTFQITSQPGSCKIDTLEKSEYEINTLDPTHFLNCRKFRGSADAVVKYRSLYNAISPLIDVPYSDPNSYGLNGIQLLFGRSDVRAVAISNHVLSTTNSCKYESSVLSSIIIHRAALGILLSCNSWIEDTEPVHIKVGSDHIILQCAQMSLSIPKVTGSFPEYERMTPKTFSGSFIADARELKNAMNRVCFLRTEVAKGIIFEVAKIPKAEIRLYTESLDLGNSSTVLGISDKEVEAKTVFAIDPLLLDKVLKQVIEGPIKVSFKNADSPIVFEHKNVRSAIQPTKLE